VLFVQSHVYWLLTFPDAKMSDAPDSSSSDETDQSEVDMDEARSYLCNHGGFVCNRPFIETNDERARPATLPCRRSTRENKLDHSRSEMSDS
jgi:hypothetical protein